MGQYADAIEDCSKAIKLFKGDSHTYAIRGLSNYALGQFSSALTDFENAISLWDIYQYYFYRGVVKTSLKQYEDAIKDFKLAVKKFDKESSSSLVVTLKDIEDEKYETLKEYVRIQNSKKQKTNPNKEVIYTYQGVSYKKDKNSTRKIIPNSQRENYLSKQSSSLAEVVGKGCGGCFYTVAFIIFFLIVLIGMGPIAILFIPAAFIFFLLTGL